MPRVIGIIQARIGSSRLPAKILAPIAGLPLLEVLVERLRSARIDEWWLATTHLADDDVTATWGEQLGLHVYRGDVDDVLSRYTAILRERQPDWFLRVTADDPFMDGAFVNRLLAALDDAEKSVSRIADVPPLVEIADSEPVFPLGYAPQLARAADVVSSESEIPADESYHRSHVLSFLRARHTPFTAAVPAGWPRRPDWRWTIDTRADLAMARTAFEAFGSEWRSLSYVDMVAVLDARSDIVSINRDVRQKSIDEG